VTLLPFCQGMRVSPSGLLPSDLRRPDGSLAAGMLAADSDRQMRSFSPWCGADRPVSPLHERPCWPLASTDAPHGHWCGSQMLRPVEARPLCVRHCHWDVVHSLTVAVRVASRHCVVPSPPTAVPCWRCHRIIIIIIIIHFISECERYAIVRPSVCRLSSVTFVRSTQAIEIFGNVSTPFGTLAICDLSVKNFTEIVPGEPHSSGGGLNRRGVAKYSDFGSF